MPRSGGTYTLPAGTDASSGEVITSAKWDNAFNDIATELTASAIKTPQYVVLAADSALPNERVLTAGTNISFVDAGAGGAITINSAFADDSVTDAKLRNSTALSVIGRATNSTGDPADIAAANDGEVLRRSGTALGFGTVATAGIANNAVTLGKMAQVATARILGRVTASTGDVEALTGTQATTLLDAFTSSLKGLAPASGGGTSNFLRADGTWTAPAGGGDVVGPGSSTDNAAARFDTTTGKLLQNSALLIADTTGDLSRSGGGGIDIEGTNTNDSPSSGQVGELVEATQAASVSLTTGTATNITSISLTAGHWWVWGNFIVNPQGANTPTNCISSINTTSATHGTSPNGGAYAQFQLPFSAGTGQVLPTGGRDLKLSGTTTVYLVATVSHSGGTGCNGGGYLGARRVR